jgi:hypothetical protein
MGVSPSAFRKLRRGAAERSREFPSALADAATLSIVFLVTGDGPEPIFEPTAGVAARGPRRSRWRHRYCAFVPG